MKTLEEFLNEAKKNNIKTGDPFHEDAYYAPEIMKKWDDNSKIKNDLVNFFRGTLLGGGVAAYKDALEILKVVEKEVKIHWKKIENDEEY